jgi:hypothetical protein
MNQSLLQRAGEALYGPRWQSEMARDLDVADRTVRRWIAGDELPAGIPQELKAICRDRIARLKDLVSEL